MSDGFLWQFGRLRQANSHSYWREANGQNDQKDTDRTQTGTKFRLMDNLGLTSTTRIATPAPTGQIVKESAFAKRAFVKSNQTVTLLSAIRGWGNGKFGFNPALQTRFF